MPLDNRCSGVLLHPTSLPGGRLGDEAYRFVDWLAAAGQTWWQVLPLGPPDEHGSPYRSASAFACWNGLLAEPDAEVTEAEAESFVARHPYWIGGWAAFEGEHALADQVRFEREWSALRAYAARKGVSLMGDVPIYVAPESADHRANPELFLEHDVAGVPPDEWSDVGQLWGNPLYDWHAMRATGYRWWVERFRRTFELVDAARIDHFRGFVAYWAVPDGAETALEGSWRRGPGRDLFDAVAAELGELPLVAEDLGVITPAVDRLRGQFGLPGMKVMQFLLPAGLEPIEVDENSVAYTGTHDNDTSHAWWELTTDAARDRTLEAARGAGIAEQEEPGWLLVHLALASRARTAIVPVQDLLGLGNEARMNTPGREDGNWSFRLEPGALDGALAARLRAATRAAGR
jgi:4-alpha-glucanotransferase